MTEIKRMFDTYEELVQYTIGDLVIDHEIIEGDKFAVRHDSQNADKTSVYVMEASGNWQFFATVNRPLYPIDPNHVYTQDIEQILDQDPVRATTSVNPIYTTIINNVHRNKQDIVDLSNVVNNIDLGAVVEWFAINSNHTAAQLDALGVGVRDYVLCVTNVTVAGTARVAGDVITRTLEPVANSSFAYRGNIFTGISNNVGNTNDTANATGTLMARLAEVLLRLGTINATGGTTTAGGANAKLNEILTRLTAARAGALDRIGDSNQAASNAVVAGVALHPRLRYVMDRVTNIGATGDTGGSATAGTVMAKLNAMFPLIHAAGGQPGADSFGHSRARYWYNPGTYTWTVPQGVTRVAVTACGGGASGQGQLYAYHRENFVLHTLGVIEPQQNPGTATIIGNLVTLNGATTHVSPGSGGAAGERMHIDNLPGSQLVYPGTGGSSLGCGSTSSWVMAVGSTSAYMYVGSAGDGAAATSNYITTSSKQISGSGGAGLANPTTFIPQLGSTCVNMPRTRWNVAGKGGGGASMQISSQRGPVEVTIEPAYAGAGGAACLKNVYAVTPGSVLNITIGSGGDYNDPRYLPRGIEIMDRITNHNLVSPYKALYMCDVGYQGGSGMCIIEW